MDPAEPMTTAIAAAPIGVLAWTLPWLPLALLALGAAILAAVVIQWRKQPGGAGAVGALPDRRRSDPRLRETEALVRELLGELDRRADRLEALIAEADARLARPEPERRVGSLEPIPRPAAARPDAAWTRERTGVDPLNQRIFSLADEGVPTVEIARRLEQPTGKVELILALRGR